MHVQCRPGRAAVRVQVPGQVQSSGKSPGARAGSGPLPILSASRCCLKFPVTVSWGTSSPGRADPRVLPSRSAPVVCHRCPLRGPPGRAHPLLSAVTAWPPARFLLHRNLRGEGEAAHGVPAPRVPRLETQPALTFLSVTPPWRSGPSAQLGEGRREEEVDDCTLLVPPGLDPRTAGPALPPWTSLPLEGLRGIQKNSQTRLVLAVAPSIRLGSSSCPPPPAQTLPPPDSTRWPIQGHPSGMWAPGWVSHPVAAASLCP